MLQGISEFVAASKRIFVVSKKPIWSDYKVMAKITGLGILFIAVIGFAIAFIFNIIMGITGMML